MATRSAKAVHEAGRPRIPAETPALRQAELERQTYIREQQGVEQRSVLRGLVLTGLIALLFSVWRAGVDRVFVGRWWWP